MQEFEVLTLENARLGGHQNLKQKIHYHLQVKIENSQLKEVSMHCYIHMNITIQLVKSQPLYIVTGTRCYCEALFNRCHNVLA